LSDRPGLENLIEVQVRFGLPAAALVEKDWFVIQALRAIAAADKGPFELVFQGGTALSRAWGLISRMSEDIDIKIVSEGPPPRNALRRLRESITAELLKAGFEFDPTNPEHRRSNYEGRYTLYRLPYAPIAEGQGALRPEIHIETSAWPIRRPPVLRPVSSFIAEAYGQAPEIEAIACTAIVETAAEKFVALTRRGGAELAGLQRDRDPTLVRHLYDLHVIKEHYDPAELATLAREIMIADARTYGHQFPAYLEDPLRETLRAVDAIAADRGFRANYAAFVRDLVFGPSPAFEVTIVTLRSLAGLVQ
jgi:predicted nucleotidyltransferase component of viral defense system